ncbi:hypothetical protein [Hymenobacter elongatus]|uniref:Uncharacterized protein n=1 Tax=Hymenobacter elongatus TaxID=877208 RepID=A0A4Z0PHA2_9BACT|nr:hypothetical protein [Hymenobacter elongatus]TGE14221.1 hypothetical protein E5J99_17035 [Hymenobacter elongatus]
MANEQNPEPNSAANTESTHASTGPARTSSQSLADSEMSVGDGALNTQPGDEQENKEADRQAVRPGSAPASAAPTASYGGNFGNSVQDIFHDADRRDNQLSNPGRGEFGAQGPGGTQGGYGNQFRADDVYGSQPGVQPVSSGGYAGGRPGNNTGTDEYNPQGSAFGHDPATPLAGTTIDPLYQNDNASPKGPDSGFSEDYGRSSLPGSTANASDGTSHQRNQSEDYIPTQNAHDNQGGVAYSPQPTEQGRTGELNGSNELGPNQEPATPTSAGSESRTGYTRNEGETSYVGNSSEGIGSKGGSYNDPNTPMNPAAGATSPTRDDYSRDAQDEAPAPPHNDDDSDYGSAPRRNAGRDNDSDRS